VVYLRVATPCCMICMRVLCAILCPVFFLHSVHERQNLHIQSAHLICTSNLHIQSANPICTFNLQIQSAHPICIQCNRPQILLHIESAFKCSRRFTAHPICTSKRKCNRPLTVYILQIYQGNSSKYKVIT
jgi:hypothetical protein